MAIKATKFARKFSHFVYPQCRCNKKAFQSVAQRLLAPTACVSIATKCQRQWGVGPEQVSSEGHQIPLAGSSLTVRSDVRGRGELYSEIQYITGSGHIGPPFSCELTDTTENIIFRQLDGYM